MNGRWKKEGSQGGREKVVREEIGIGRNDQEREEGGYGSRSSASGDGCAHVYGICKCHTNKKVVL